MHSYYHHNTSISLAIFTCVRDLHIILVETCITEVHSSWFIVYLWHLNDIADNIFRS